MAAPRVIRPSSFLEAIERMGAHEARTRREQVRAVLGDYGLQLPGTMIAAIGRAGFVSSLSRAEPVTTSLVEFGSSHLFRLYLADGRHAREMTAADSRAAEVIERLSAAPIEEPIICSTLIGMAEEHPFMVFDGWHRAKAWQIRVDRGETDPLPAFVITTRHPPSG
jgi:hypothetical protein